MNPHLGKPFSYPVANISPFLMIIILISLFCRFRYSQYIAWIMLHPFILSTIVVMGYTYLNFSADPIPSLLLRGYRANKQALVFSIVDCMIYGNWFYNVATAIMLPIWLLFWNVMRSSIAIS